MVQGEKQNKPQFTHLAKSPSETKVLVEIAHPGLPQGRPALGQTESFAAASPWQLREKGASIKQERLYTSTSQPSPLPAPRAGSSKRQRPWT